MIAFYGDKTWKWQRCSKDMLWDDEDRKRKPNKQDFRQEEAIVTQIVDGRTNENELFTTQNH